MSVVQESAGDIFSAPPGSVLLHACNCEGVWGAGVALEFKRRFPAAFTAYEAHCNVLWNKSYQKSLLGTAILIPHYADDKNSNQDRPQYWIACAFTSLGYGRQRSPANVILESTRKAITNLGETLSTMRNSGVRAGDVWTVRMNSGNFGVKWDRTKSVLEQCGMRLKVVYPLEAVNARNLVRERSGRRKTAGKEAGKGLGVNDDDGGNDDGNDDGGNDDGNDDGDDTVAKEKGETQSRRLKRSKTEAKG